MFHYTPVSPAGQWLVFSFVLCSVSGPSSLRSFMRAFMVFTLVLTASVCMAERPVARQDAGEGIQALSITISDQLPPPVKYPVKCYKMTDAEFFVWATAYNQGQVEDWKRGGRRSRSRILQRHGEANELAGQIHDDPERARLGLGLAAEALGHQVRLAVAVHVACGGGRQRMRGVPGTGP